MPPKQSRSTAHPPVGIIYLCCDDLDIEALGSLANLEYEGKRYLIIHDDSKSASVRAELDAAAERLRGQESWEVIVLRRPLREGGKPGAVNYVLEQTGHLYEYFFLCDNDSTVLDFWTIEKAVPFAGFYVGQTVLLLYLAVTFMIVPVFLHVYRMSLAASLSAGSLIIALIYLPTLVYFAKERKLAECFGSVVACGFVYGATDFSCARGVWDCLWNRDKEWTPTNSKSQEGGKMGLC